MGLHGHGEERGNSANLIAHEQHLKRSPCGSLDRPSQGVQVVTWVRWRVQRYSDCAFRRKDSLATASGALCLRHKLLSRLTR